MTSSNNYIKFTCTHIHLWTQAVFNAMGVGSPSLEHTRDRILQTHERVTRELRARRQAQPVLTTVQAPKIPRT